VHTLHETVTPVKDDTTFWLFETLMHVLYKPKLHHFIKDQQLMNFNGEQRHAWKLQCNVLSFTIIVLTNTLLYDLLSF
jgi:hypothetical protein